MINVGIKHSGRRPPTVTSYIVSDHQVVLAGCCLATGKDLCEYEYNHAITSGADPYKNTFDKNTSQK